MTPDPRQPSRSGPDIDVRLREWRRRRDVAADAAGRVRRIAAAVRAADVAAIRPAIAPPVRWVERTGWFAAGLAAAAMVACVAWRNGASDETANWPPSVRFAAADIAARAEVLAGMEQTFAGRLAWVAEHDQTVTVGLADGSAAATSVAVRIVVLTRRGPAARWEPAWQTDVVVRDEQVVDVAAGAHGDGRLKLWAHCLPDGAITVDGE